MIRNNVQFLKMLKKGDYDTKVKKISDLYFQSFLLVQPLKYYNRNYIGTNF